MFMRKPANWTMVSRVTKPSESAAMATVSLMVEQGSARLNQVGSFAMVQWARSCIKREGAGNHSHKGRVQEQHARQFHPASFLSSIDTCHASANPAETHFVLIGR